MQDLELFQAETTKGKKPVSRYSVKFQDLDRPLCLGPIRQVAMNPCVRRALAQNGEVVEYTWDDELSPDFDDIKPLVTMHADGCDGSCNHGPADPPPAIIEYGMDGGYHVVMWTASDKELSSDEQMKLAELAVSRGWLLCTSHPNFHWGNRNGSGVEWFAERFGDVVPEGYTCQGSVNYRNLNRKLSKSGDTKVVMFLEGFWREKKGY